MLRYFGLIGLVAVICALVYKHAVTMGYLRNNRIVDYELGLCENRYHRVKQLSEIFYLNNTVDADMLVGNGMALLINANFYPGLVGFMNSNGLSTSENSKRTLTSYVFMLDMNQLDLAEPLPLNIVRNGKTDKQLNLFALSIYTDGMGLKLIAANYVPQKLYKDERNDEYVIEHDAYTIEKFIYDGETHQLVHSETYLNGLDIGELCDLVAVDDYIFYFTKCHSSKYLKQIKFLTQYKDGEIWVFNARRHEAYPVQRNLLMPISIAYIKSRSLIVTSNLDVNGLTFYRREYDNSLTWIQDVDLNGLVFNMFIDLSGSIWTVVHPKPHQTFNILNCNQRQTPANLYHIRLESRETIFLTTTKTYFQTNGTTINALSAVISHKDNFVLFSMLNQPRVCFNMINKINP